MIERLADQIAGTATWPTQIVALSHILEEHIPGFNKEKFVRRAILKWEENYEPPFIDDSIPY